MHLLLENTSGREGMNKYTIIKKLNVVAANFRDFLSELVHIELKFLEI